ncbi:MAG: UDP-N-acetyl glucosamine 2-epimerase [Pirellulaceae bacterium]|nr:UDP-N-acetyl glucosamine 2-epimerase [Pirellulaceae bacterium]
MELIVSSVGRSPAPRGRCGHFRPIAQFGPRRITARAAAGNPISIDRNFAKALPDMMSLQGDTTTILCAAPVAYCRQIPIDHVESGLRRGDRRAPFSEEIDHRPTLLPTATRVRTASNSAPGGCLPSNQSGCCTSRAPGARGDSSVSLAIVIRTV